MITAKKKPATGKSGGVKTHVKNSHIISINRAEKSIDLGGS